MNRLVIVLAMLIVIGWPLSLWWIDGNAYDRGETDCQTKSQSAVIKQQRKLDALLQVAQTKAKDRDRIIDGYERKLRYTNNNGCPDSRVADLRAGVVRDTIRSLMSTDSGM